MRVRLDHIEDVAVNIKMFWFVGDKPANNTAGQFIELRLPHERADSRGERRWFTLSSSPTEKMLAITTKIAPQNGSSFKNALLRLKPGDEAMMSEPMGDFVLPKIEDIPLVFVAGGIGITPMRSMVKWLIDSGEHRDIHLIYSAKSSEEIAFRDLFESYGLRLDAVTNRLDAGKIIELIGDTTGKLVYLSGPEPMVETLFKELPERGLPARQLVTDYFLNYPDI